MKITRRHFLRSAAAGIAAMGLPLAAEPAARTAVARAAEPDAELRIGYLPITDAAPLLIAHARGYFRDEGLKVAKPLRVRSWSTLSESFMTDKFNLTHMLLPMPIWMRYNRSLPVKVLAWDHTNGSAITVRADSGINGFADLGGHQIAVPYWYSMHNIILQMGLKKAGLTPVIQPQNHALGKRQVNLFILAPPEMPVALSGRKIDGFIVAEPFNAMAEMRVGGRIMRFSGDIWKNHPCCVVVMKEPIIKSNPVFTQKVVNAIVRAQLWTTENMAEAARVLSREGEGYLPTSAEVLLRVFTGYELSVYGPGNTPQAIQNPEWNVGRIGFQPYPYPSATRFILSEMRRTRMEGNAEFLDSLDPDLAAADLVDESFVRKAIDAVGGPSRFPAIDIARPWDREEVIDL